MIANRVAEGLRPGREAAFRELMARSEAPLRAFIRQSEAAHLADDFLQQTFLKAWKRIDFDPAHQGARAYLFKVAERLIADWLRSPEHSSISLDQLSARGSLVPSLLDTHARDPLAKLMSEEPVASLRAALARLAPEQREVLERFYLLQEGTQLDIARAMNLSVPAFNSRLNRARLELKRLLVPGPPTPRTSPSNPSIQP